jgi:hypothetical protein
VNAWIRKTDFDSSLAALLVKREERQDNIHSRRRGNDFYLNHDLKNSIFKTLDSIKG